MSSGCHLLPAVGPLFHFSPKDSSIAIGTASMNKSLKVVTSALLVPLVDNLGISSTNQLTLVKPESWIADSSIFFASPSATNISLPGKGPVVTSRPSSQFLEILGNVLFPQLHNYLLSVVPFHQFFQLNHLQQGLKLAVQKRFFDLVTY